MKPERRLRREFRKVDKWFGIKSKLQIQLENILFLLIAFTVMIVIPVFLAVLINIKFGGAIT